MIWNIIIKFIFIVIEGLFSLFPVVSFSQIPTVGPFIVANFTRAVNLFNGFLSTFPYAQLPWTIFKILLAFEILLLIGKFFLGHRNPVATN